MGEKRIALFTKSYTSTMCDVLFYGRWGVGNKETKKDFNHIVNSGFISSDQHTHSKKKKKTV